MPKRVTWMSPWKRPLPVPSGGSCSMSRAGSVRWMCKFLPASPTDNRCAFPVAVARTSLIFRIRLAPAPSLRGGRQGRSDRIALGTLGGGIGCEGRGSNAGWNGGVDRACGSPVRPEAKAARRGAFPGSPAGDQMVTVKLVTPAAQWRRGEGSLRAHEARFQIRSACRLAVAPRLGISRRCYCALKLPIPRSAHPRAAQNRAT